MARRLFLTVLTLSLLMPMAQADARTPKTEDEKIVYAIGVVLSRYVTQFGFSDDEFDLVAAGLKAGASGDDPAVDMNEYGPKIQQFEQDRAAIAAERASEVAAEESKKATAFLDKMRKTKGAKTTDSGLIYIETKAGDGASPTATDTVTVHYHGTLRDGKVFDSSVDRGQPASFGLNRVIPCWTEGVQLMKVGGKATLVCPADIAYGERGAGGAIKPGAALKFDVELIGIE